MRRLNKLKKNDGFSLAESLITVLLVIIIFGGIGGVLVVGKNSYRNITKKAEAQVLFSTTANVLKKDLSTATNFDQDSQTFYNQQRKYVMYYKNEDDGIVVVNTTKSEEEKLLPEKVKTSGLHGELSNITYVSKDGDPLVTPYYKLTLRIKDKDGKKIYENDLNIRAVNE